MKNEAMKGDVGMKWEKVLIPEVLFFQEGPGVRNTQFTSSGVKLLNVGNINNGTLDLDATKIYISEEEAFGKYSHFLVEDGDLLIASSGIVVDNFHNKITWAKAENLPLCMNTSTIRFKSLDSSVLDIKYFSYFLKTRFFSDQLRKLITGSAQLNFGPSHLKQISLPLPPLPIQQRIAEILDAADALRRKDEELLRKYDELAQAIFFDMFDKTESNDFNPVTILDIVEKGKNKLRSGPFGSDLLHSEFVDFGVFVLGIDNVVNNKFEINRKRFITEEKFNALSRYQVYPGDVLISVMATIGRTAVVPDNLGKAINSKHLVAITPNKEIIDSFFLSYLFANSQSIKRQIKRNTKGAIMDGLNIGIIKELNFNLPPIEIQKKFVENLKCIEHLKKLLLTSKSGLLFVSLIQKAFKGELVK